MEVRNRLNKNMQRANTSIYGTPTSSCSAKIRSSKSTFIADTGEESVAGIACNGGVSLSGSMSHLSSKPMSQHLLEALNGKLKEESIDMTCNPYSDDLGFCGIPPALVQRYADEFSPFDVYEVADALDHLRLEALAQKGRRGVRIFIWSLSNLMSLPIP
jgi:hypothetical protein